MFCNGTAPKRFDLETRTQGAVSLDLEQNLISVSTSQLTGTNARFLDNQLHKNQATTQLKKVCSLTHSVLFLKCDLIQNNLR